MKITLKNMSGEYVCEKDTEANTFTVFHWGKEVFSGRLDKQYDVRRLDTLGLRPLDENGDPIPPPWRRKRLEASVSSRGEMGERKTCRNKGVASGLNKDAHGEVATSP